ncbi:MAG TPA: Hint domain-containing protein, partial [Vicinamibacterales bacterium]
VTVDQRPHPAGREGSLISLKEVAERAWKARMSPRLRAWATQRLAEAGTSSGTRRQKAQTILDAYRKKVPYIADPVMGEFIATPEQTLCLDEGGLCIIGGDCFPEGTLLLRDDFELVPVERIKEGERIWGRDRWSTVENVWSKGEMAVDAVKLSTETTLRLTSDHQVYLHDARRVRVGQLNPGDRLLQPTSMQVVYGGIRKRDERTPVAIVRSIERATKDENAGEIAHCWDISTDDHYVYLPEHDVTVSNCDDAATVLIASMLTIGIPAMVIGSSHKHPHDVPTHVFGAFQDEQDDWVRMDGTTKHPVGRVAAHGREWWVEPGAEAKNRGEGDFVGMAGVGGEVGTSGGAREPVSALDLMYPHIR